MISLLLVWLIGTLIMSLGFGFFGNPDKYEDANILLVTAGWPIVVLVLIGALFYDLIEWLTTKARGDAS